MILDDSGRLGDDGSSLFVEPMRYMESSVLGTVSGKLYCPQYAQTCILLLSERWILFCAVMSAVYGGSLYVIALHILNFHDQFLRSLPQFCAFCRCKAKLGSFNWAGMRNCRNEMVVPAFQLHLSRLDRFIPPSPGSGFSEQSNGSPF